MMLQREVTGLGSEVGAHGETDKIVRVRERISLVEIVDTPDQSAFGVAPGAKVFHMQVANRQDLWRLGKIGADLGPNLCPAIVRSSKEWEDLGLHAGVLQAQVFLNDIGAFCQPVFIPARSFDDVHTAEDSRGECRSQLPLRNNQNSAEKNRVGGRCRIEPAGQLVRP